MNPTDDQRLRQRLHEEFGALEISPPPVLRVTGRGRGIRARRRALTAGTAILATLAVAAAAHFGKAAAAPAVTLNQPNPAAPGGVFASGTADGKRWELAVRNIAARPGTSSCLPAVMFNGRDGDVLFKVGRRAPSFGNPAFLTGIAGFPGVGAAFTQVSPDTTRLVLTFPDGRSISARPVRVRACGRSFNLAGLAFSTRRAPSDISTYTRDGLDEGLQLNPGVPMASLYPPARAQIWENLDKSRADLAASEAASPIGAGTVGGQTWHIRASLGLFGQCYTATLRDPGHGRGQSPAQCVPVAAPPRTVALDPVSIPGATTELPGYAGLVNPRTARVEVALSDGIIPPATPVTVAGRAYVAFAIPPGCQVLQLKLFDSHGHMFASATHVPPAG